jgi:transposase
MSTSLLYHGFGIRGYQYVKSTYEAGRVTFTLLQERGNLRCAACGSRRVVRRGFQPRRFRSLPIGSRPVQIELNVARVGCVDCGEVRQVPVDFADERRSYTHAFERYVLELSHHMTIRDVAGHLGVGWDLVKGIQKRSLNRRFRRVKLKHLRRIAIDEIAIGRGHRYLTVVLDLKSGAVVFVGEGKGADALIPFWKRLKRCRARIEAVAMDMSPAYISAVQTYLSKAVIVFDHFHIIKLAHPV